MSEKHIGSCHCGAVEYQVTGPFAKGAVCDCSICTRKGAVMVMVDRDKLDVTKGAENLTEYQFNTKAAIHYFCKTCGIYTHHQKRRDDNYAFNIGCVDSFSVDDLEEVMKIEGSAFSTVESE